jgi:hypothetical protein
MVREGLEQMGAAYEAAGYWVEALRTFQAVVDAKPEMIGEMFQRMSQVSQHLMVQIGELQQRKGSAVVKKNEFAAENASLKRTNERLATEKQQLEQEKVQWEREKRQMDAAKSAVDRRLEQRTAPAAQGGDRAMGTREARVGKAFEEHMGEGVYRVGQPVMFNMGNEEADWTGCPPGRTLFFSAGRSSGRPYTIKEMSADGKFFQETTHGFWAPVSALAAPLKEGDKVIFTAGSNGLTKKTWVGCPDSRLAFNKGNEYAVAKVSQCRKFFLTTQHTGLWCPSSSVRVKGEAGTSGHVLQKYEDGTSKECGRCQMYGPSSQTGDSSCVLPANQMQCSQRGGWQWC